MKRLILFFLLGSFSLSATDKEPSLVSKNKVPKLLKSLAYATIRSTVLGKYNDWEKKEYKLQTCPSNFPEMPGGFFCSLLDENQTLDSIDNSSESIDAKWEGSDDVNQSLDVFEVLVSKTKSPNMSGKVLRYGEGYEETIVFFKPKGIISHYKYKDTIVIFKWGNQNELLSLIFVKVNRDMFPETVKEYLF
ncbi:hypothetical protein P3G55_04880 [Leptospira sp. 96542]|nr:hypothetical protein [Leptospira sp. 96542]